VKLALLFLALLLALSLVLGEVPLGDASGCVLLPFTILIAFAGAVVVIVKRRSWIGGAIGALLILLTGLHIAFGPLYYRGARIESRVVEENGDPVTNATVVATWETTRGTMLARVATHTDRGGSFVITPWRPRLRPPFDVLDPTQPTITVSAAGFRPAEERDDSLRERVAAVSGEQWGKEIVLYKP